MLKFLAGRSTGSSSCTSSCHVVPVATAGGLLATSVFFAWTRVVGAGLAFALAGAGLAAARAALAVEGAGAGAFNAANALQLSRSHLSSSADHFAFEGIIIIA